MQTNRVKITIHLFLEKEMQDELQKTVNNIAESYKIKVTAKEKPVAFEPFSLNHHESFIQDLKSVTRMTDFMLYIHNHHPALFETAYQAALDGDR